MVATSRLAPAQGGDDRGRRRAIVGRDRPIREGQSSIGTHDEVATELAGVVGGATQLLAGPHELDVLLDCRGPIDRTH